MPSNSLNAGLEQLKLPCFPPLPNPRTQDFKVNAGSTVHVINNPSKDKSVIISSGAYNITFIKNKGGQIVETGFSIDKQVLGNEDMYIPKHLFKPAHKLACIVLTDHENRIRKNSRKKSMF